MNGTIDKTVAQSPVGNFPAGTAGETEDGARDGAGSFDRLREAVVAAATLLDSLSDLATKVVEAEADQLARTAPAWVVYRDCKSLTEGASILANQARTELLSAFRDAEADMPIR